MSFDFKKLIGKGGYAEVYLLQDKNTNKLYAGKYVKPRKMNQKELSLYQTEKKILRSYYVNPNPNIIHLYNVFRYEINTDELLVLEYCNGGSLLQYLYDYIAKNGKPFPENLVRHLMKQILKGVNSLHERGIIHRDLKLNNILLKYNNNNDLIKQNIYAAEIKIIDFNTSYFPNIDLPKTVIGTLPNMAPTIINNAYGFEGLKIYDEKIDIWSLGTLCYEMLFGKPLFGNIQNNDMVLNIYNCNFNIPNTISSQARNFLYSMLQKKGSDRLSAAQLLNHDFIKNINLVYFENNYLNNHFFNRQIINNNFDNINQIHNNKKQLIHIFFNDSDGKTIVIITDFNETLDNVIKRFLCRINRQDLLNNYKTKINFYFNGKNLNSCLNNAIGQINLMDILIINVSYSSNF